MNGFWLVKFDELATFNADTDKSKYNAEYLAKMAGLQIEYNDMLASYGRSNGFIIIESDGHRQRIDNLRIAEMNERAALGVQYYG